MVVLRTRMRGADVDVMIPDSELTDCLTQLGFTRTVVPGGDREAPGRVPEQTRDGRERDAALNQPGGERVAEGVGVEAGFAKAQAPAGEDPADGVRRELEMSFNRTLRPSDRGAAEDALAALDRLVAQRDDAVRRLATDAKDLRAEVEILRSEARQLRAAKASAEQKLDDIRSVMHWLSAGCFGMPYALHKIEGLLPPEDIGHLRPGAGQEQPAQRPLATPPVGRGHAEHPPEEA